LGGGFLAVGNWWHKIKGQVAKDEKLRTEILK